MLGSNPQMSVGADSTIAPLFAVAVARLAASGSANYVDLVGIVAVMWACLSSSSGAAPRLGRGVPLGADHRRLHVRRRGDHRRPPAARSPRRAPRRGLDALPPEVVAEHLGSTNGPTLAIGAAVFAVVVAAERIDRRLPGALLGLVGSTVIVAAAGLHSNGVALLGSFSHGAPRLGLFDFSTSTLASVAPVAGVVALVVVSQTAATTRAFADQGPLRGRRRP